MGADSYFGLVVKSAGYEPVLRDLWARRFDWFLQFASLGTKSLNQTA